MKKLLICLCLALLSNISAMATALKNNGELKEREKKLLEKKSEVVRRYLNENILPLLAKGILKICEKLPDDPVESLANFLLENRFEKKLTEKLENNNKNNFENNNINFNEDTLKIEGEDFIEQKSEHNVENDIDL